MRRLLLLRHSEAVSPEGFDDLDRPLTQAGQNASRRIGSYLAQERLRPDLALVSPARRAQDTWALVGSLLDDVPMRSEPRIYGAPPDRLLAVCKEAEPQVQILLVVGHNPGLQELLRLLMPHEDRYAHTNLIANYPPAGLAIVECPAPTWRELSPRSARLDRLVTPRSLGYGEDE